jgi:hypothetical protein
METAKRKSGRKPVADENKKIQICIYVEKRIIDANGGMEETKEKCIDFLFYESQQNKIEN